MRKPNPEVVSPTIFIGLGGTGHAVLTRLRRIFYTRYRLPELPVTRFIWMDTDVDGLQGERPDVVDQRIQMQRGESAIDLSVRAPALKSLYDNSRTTSTSSSGSTQSFTTSATRFCRRGRARSGRSGGTPSGRTTRPWPASWNSPGGT